MIQSPVLPEVLQGQEHRSDDLGQRTAPGKMEAPALHRDVRWTHIFRMQTDTGFSPSARQVVDPGAVLKRTDTRQDAPTT